VAAGDVVQSAGGNTGAATTASLTVGLPADVGVGNTVLLVVIGDDQPATPTHWTLINAATAIWVYSSTNQEGVDVEWTDDLAFPEAVAAAWYEVEIEGIWTHGPIVNAANLYAADTQAAGATLTADAGGLLVDLIGVAQLAPTAVGKPVSWSDGFTGSRRARY